jgi:hypothetical protein
MWKRIKLHWEGEDGFWQTVLLNGITGILLALLTASVIAFVVIGLLAVIRAPSAVAFPVALSCAGIPVLCYGMWLWVGMLRYGFRVWRDKTSTRFQKIGGLIALLLVIHAVPLTVATWTVLITKIAGYRIGRIE